MGNPEAEIKSMTGRPNDTFQFEVVKDWQKDANVLWRTMPPGLLEAVRGIRWDSSSVGNLQTGVEAAETLVKISH